KDREAKMNRRPTQFGVRENTASSRQHASRHATDSLPSMSAPFPTGSQHRQLRPVLASHASEPEESVTIKPRRGATGEEKGDRVETFSAPVTVIAGDVPRQVFEPLIGCEEATKLLGNIHVKTLQRYARRGTLPGYRVAGHWYFRATELDAWLRSRI